MKKIILVCVLVLWSAAFSAMKWQDDSAIASKVWYPQTKFEGRLVCAHKISTGDINGTVIKNGIVLTDGRNHTLGAQPLLSTNILQMWGVDGVGIFSHSLSSAAAYSIQKSPDGIQPFVKCDDITASTNSLGRSFVDCGRHTVAGVEKRILLYFQYPTADIAAGTAKVFVSAEAVDAEAGDNGKWDELFSEVAAAIRHFHGGVYIKDKGLYVFTGDASPTTAASILFAGDKGHKGFHSSATASDTVLTDNTASWTTDELKDRTIYNVTDGTSGVITANAATTVTVGLGGMTWSQGDICAIDSDIGELVKAPATWFDRWCLGDGDRDEWAADHKSAWILGGNSQTWRTVDLVTADNKSAYWIPDSAANGLPNATTSNRVYKLNLEDTGTDKPGTVSVLKDDGIFNFGWYGGASTSGLVYLTTQSTMNEEETGWWEGNNGIPEIYCIDPETDEIASVKKFPSNGIAPWTAFAWVGIKSGLMEFGGSMTALNGLVGHTVLDSSGDEWNIPSVVVGRCEKQKAPTANVITATTLATTLHAANVYGETRNRISFTGGKSIIAVNDVIRGKTSLATGTVREAVNITANAGWGGTTTGNFQIYPVTGMFLEGEDIQVVTAGSPPTYTDAAVVNGFFIWQFLPADSVTAETGYAGEVVRYTGIAKAVPAATGLRLNLSAAQQKSLRGQFVTFSVKMWIDPSTEVGTTDGTTLKPYFFMQTRPNQFTMFRKYYGSLKTGQWIDLSCTTYVGKYATVIDFLFYPHSSLNSGNNQLLYIRDFQLVKSAMPNSSIVTNSRPGGWLSR